MSGVEYSATLPQDALPDCSACEKPELWPENVDAAILYGHVQGQQQVAGMSGHFFGVRIEALIAAANWLYEAGRINNIDRAIDGAQEIDRINCRHHNAKVDARIEADRAR